jgi:hypothetical protein
VTSIGTLCDNFSHGINPHLWTVPTSGSLGTAATSTVATTWTPSPSLYGATLSGSTEIPSLICTTSGGNSPVGVSSTTTYDLTGSGLWFEFVSFSTNNSGLQGYVSIGTSAGYFWWNFQNTGTLEANDPANGPMAIAGGFTSPSNRFLRVRESSGTVYYDTSADSVTWNNATAITYSIGITAMTVSLYSNGSGSGSATFAMANLNPVF